MKKPRQIEFFDDERDAGNGVIVTLQYGFSFEPGSHEGVRGFDTRTAALRRSALKRIFVCECDLCKGRKS